MTAHIQNILFDLGMVMLELDYGPALEKLEPHCRPHLFDNSTRFFRAVQQDPQLRAYERGEITSEQFFQHFVEISGFSGTMEEFHAIWRSIFIENHTMIQFGRTLSADYDIYFLSNASELHVPYVYERFPSLRFFKGDAISCYLGSAKPDNQFYLKALEKFGISPDTCLFIDDLPENVAGAEACGIESILHTTAERTIELINGRLRP